MGLTYWKTYATTLLLALGLLSGISTHAHIAADGPPGGTTNWHMIFNDDFNGTTMNTAYWHHCFEANDLSSSGVCGTFNGNGALEADTTSAITEHDGYLWITAQHQPVSTPDGGTRQYSSGMISTSGLFSFTYGYMEIRFRIPSGKALWPGFYTVYSDPNDTYPEIDVMEVRGQYPNVLWMTDHYVDQFGYQESDYSTYEQTNYATGFHSVGVDWEPNSVTWYVDGVARKSIPNSIEMPRKPMILRMSLEVGGNWNGPPDTNTPFPSSLVVDWVRVWQHGAPAATPTGTTTQTLTPTATTKAHGADPTSRSTGSSFDFVAWLLIFGPPLAIIVGFVVFYFRKGLLRRN